MTNLSAKIMITKAYSEKDSTENSCSDGFQNLSIYLLITTAIDELHLKLSAHESTGLILSATADMNGCM